MAQVHLPPVLSRNLPVDSIPETVAKRLVDCQHAASKLTACKHNNSGQAGVQVQQR
jgi:hypothetical protein